MRKFAVVLGMCAFAGAAQASDGAVAIKFGLPGEWAVDCVKPASLDNMRQLFVANAQGLATMTVDLGPKHVPEFDVLSNLVLATPDSLIVTFTRESDHYVSRVTIRKKGNRTQTQDSTNAATGEALIRDAKFVKTKRPVPWVTKCGT